MRLLLASFVLGEARALPQQTATWLAIGYLACSTVIGIVLLVYVIPRWTPSATTYGSVLSPIITVARAARVSAGAVEDLAAFVGASDVWPRTLPGRWRSLGTYAGAASP